MNIYKNKKVVVTGGSGFVGTHFIQELLERGANIRTSIHNNPLKNRKQWHYNLKITSQKPL